ncbi:hypothetical protein Pint_13831 [Pistacia integerrima]|uniref:Uncharacterized protein n=1 Tax=Pistacia integerrima TaxID=434235 RepID=A0ACC0Y9K7_9ROSI|nr:hypothetical protein Pint_13831 [Pistacia integerrima]
MEKEGNLKGMLMGIKKGNEYVDFRTAMLTKPPVPSFSQFGLALQEHETKLILSMHMPFLANEAMDKTGVAELKNNVIHQQRQETLKDNNNNVPMIMLEEFPQELTILSLNDINDPSFYVESGATSQ